MPAIAGLTLVARRAQVMYTPTTKAACTTIKHMLASAEGTYRADLVDQLTVGHISRGLTIHHPSIHGLPRLLDLPEREQRHILTSPDWVRLAGVRDPISRAYSAWEHRILLLKQRRPHAIASLVPDAMVDGRIDLVASFATFAKALAHHTDTFMVDHHFLPQSHIVRADAIDYNMLVRVDQPGTIPAIADMLHRRTSRVVTPMRLNEGLGVKVSRVCDQHTANHLMSTYAMDYEAFGFERQSYAAQLEPYVLSELEQSLLQKYHSLVERTSGISRAARARTGVKFAVRQIGRSVRQRVHRRNEPVDPREMHI